jgi:hypothetical protein
MSATAASVEASRWDRDSRSSSRGAVFGALALGLAVGAAAAVASCKSRGVAQCDGADKVFTREEIAKHNSVEKGVWVTYGDG